MDLELPVRRVKTDAGFDTRPEAVRAWVDDLPLINPNQSRLLLDEALREINSHIMPTKNRQETLELLATSVMCVTESLKKRFLSQPIPLRGNALQLAAYSVELCNQMATGYRILTDDLGQSNYQTASLAVAIHRSLRYLSEVLLTNYQIYTQYPEGLWKTINALYLLAEQHDIARLPVTDTTLSCVTRSTINTVYKQILLMSLACPYRLRQKEIHFVYNALMDWADIAGLHVLDDSEPRGLFAIDLSTDRPPSYLALINRDPESRYWRSLDTTAMADRIHDLFKQKPGSSTRHIGIGDSTILQRLMLAWGVMPKRRFSRYSRSARVSLVAGLNAIHHCITEPAEEAENNEDSIGDEHYLMNPTFEKTSAIRNRFSSVTDAHTPVAGLPPASARASRVETWSMANYSAGGYSLLWDSSEASGTTVGELVAILEEDSAAEGSWNLGVVRWMKCTKAYGLELGIQMLSPGAQAVWTSLYESSVDSRKKMRGIMLPEVRVLHQQASLILPTLPFRAGVTATLETADSLENIKLTRQLENTGSFAQFNFTTAIND